MTRLCSNQELTLGLDKDLVPDLNFLSKLLLGLAEIRIKVPFSPF